MPIVTRLRAVAPPVAPVVAVVLLGLLLGAFAADGWRLGVPLLSALSGVQALWAVLPFAAGWRYGGGHLRRGAVVGGLTGLSGIAGYYLWEWLAYTAHAATSQLTRSGGLFWVVGATVGGVLFGLLGAAGADRDEDGRGVAGAAVLLTAAVPAAEMLLVLWLDRTGWATDDVALHLGWLLLMVAALVVLAWTRAPGRMFGRALLLAAPVAALALGLFWLAESRLAYLTL